MTKKQIGLHLRKLRILKGLSQTQLAESAGTITGAISLLEQGRKNISIDGLLSILTALDCEIKLTPAEPVNLKPEYENL